MWKIKNRVFFISLVSCLTILYSCANLKPTTNVEKWSLDLSKGGCLDVCKAYTLHISQDGTYIYKGTFNVKHLGNKTGEIQSDELTQLQQLMSTIDWPVKDTIYGTRAEDSSAKKLQYTSQEGNKTIEYYRAEPREIRVLELFMDKIINRDDF